MSVTPDLSNGFRVVSLSYELIFINLFHHHSVMNAYLLKPGYDRGFDHDYSHGGGCVRTKLQRGIAAEQHLAPKNEISW